MTEEKLSGTVGNDPQSSDKGESVADTSVATRLATEPYVGTYRTKEDAEKGLHEKDETIGRLKNEKGELLSEKKRLEEQVLFKLAEAIDAQRPSDKPVKSDADIQVELQKLATRIDDEGGKAIIDVLTSYGHDIETSIVQRTAKQTEELQKLIGALQRQVEEQNPEYLSRKEIVGELEKKFPQVGRATLLEIAKLYIKPVEQPTRPPIAGTTKGEITPSEPDDTSSGIADQIESLLKTHMKATKEEIEKLKGKKK